MFALMRSKSSAVVASGEGWRFRYRRVSLGEGAGAIEIGAYILQPSDTFFVGPSLRVWIQCSAICRDETRDRRAWEHGEGSRVTKEISV